MSYNLTDEQWQRIEPLFPTQVTGRPAADKRRILNGIIWIARTNNPWRMLPPEYGPWQTVYSQLQKWIKLGILTQIIEELQKTDWEYTNLTATDGRLGLDQQAD
ncbi:transposase [Secundilactobacillus similis]|nr:transposase [Secundilactobacillus similis]